ncbi:MAG: hypothetical protein KAG53_08055 [Endozoicomonadaceae bacterium]|nr:hypothetical protein [Endozoicomonadaceae bacterium]
MTTFQYAIAWIAYLVGALGCLAVWWRMTRSFGQGLPRRSLRMIATCVILAPAISNPGMEYLGPALLVCLFDALSQGSVEAMHRTAPIILISLLVAMLLAVLGGLFIKTPTDNLSIRQPKKVRRSRKAPVL